MKKEFLGKDKLDHFLYSLVICAGLMSIGFELFPKGYYELFGLGVTFTIGILWEVFRSKTVSGYDLIYDFVGAGLAVIVFIMFF